MTVGGKCRPQNGRERPRADLEMRTCRWREGCSSAPGRPGGYDGTGNSVGRASRERERRMGGCTEGGSDDSTKSQGIGGGREGEGGGGRCSPPFRQRFFFRKKRGRPPLGGSSNNNNGALAITIMARACERGPSHPLGKKKWNIQSWKLHHPRVVRARDAFKI